MMHVYEVRPRKDKRGVDLISLMRFHLVGCASQDRARIAFD